MSISQSTNINNSYLYDWVIRHESHYPVVLGIIATSEDQARNLLRAELETQLTISPGISSADVSYIGPYTGFCGTKEAVEYYQKENLPFSSISREILENSLSGPPFRVTPIYIGTVVLFTALDG